MKRLFLVSLVAFLFQQSGYVSASPQVPAGKQLYTITLAYVADPSILGRQMDVYMRQATSQTRPEIMKLILPDVLVVALRDGGRQATLALDEKGIRLIHKYEKVGRDLLLRSDKTL